MYRIRGVMIKLIVAYENFRHVITVPENILFMPEGQLWNMKVFLEPTIHHNILINTEVKT